MRTVRLLTYALAALAGTIPSAAAAQSCTWSVSSVVFGTVDTLSGSTLDITGTVAINCTGIASRTIQLCPNIGVGTGGLTESNRQMLSGSNPLTFQLYSDTWGGTIWGSDLVSPTPPASPSLTLTLNGAGTGSLSQPIYGRVFSGQSTAAISSYTSAFSGVSGRLCYRYTGSCHSSCGSQTDTSFNATAAVASNCRVTASTLNFGSQGLLTANVDATNTISVTCTPSTAWVLSLNAGSGGGTVVVRKMTGPAGAKVNYTIYRDSARTQVWGDGTSGTFTMAGTGSGSAQAQTGYGRVPSQTTPAPGGYSDTMVVTVTY